MKNTIRFLYRYFRNLLLLAVAKNKGREMRVEDDVLIISPHPDDEILGCGGLISQLNRRKGNVYIIFMTKGENVDDRFVKSEIIEERNRLTRKALCAVGQSLDKCFFLNFPDGSIDFTHPETQILESLIKKINPQVICIPNLNDGWSDHVQTNLIIRSLVKGISSIQLYEYCVWFWYTMPFKTVFSIDWDCALILRMKKMDQELKKKAIKIYLDAKDARGLPYSGNLPEVLVKSCSWKSEVYFLIKLTI
jgi:LmbE family N-acetylglucosaminyl deacetylase